MGSPQRSEVSANYQMGPQVSIVDAVPSPPYRISSSAEWDGLERRGERGDQVDTFYGYQVGSVVTRGQKLSDQSGHEGRDEGDL